MLFLQPSRLHVLRVLLLAVGAALAVVILTLPPNPRDLGGLDGGASNGSAPSSAQSFPVTITGAYHIHTTRSDGSGSVDKVAAAARRAGLQFMILTDHGDATRAPDPPAYRNGVLVIDGVEISTDDGHYVALDLPRAPYPLAGESRDVAEDVRRLGGFGVAAHPDSRKAELAWSDWRVPIDGLEWLNADSEWRDESWPSTALLFLRYPYRPTATLMTMLTYPERLMARWDALATKRRVIGLIGADAHARLWGRPEANVLSMPAALRVPSYESSFRLFALQVQLDRPLSGSGPDDGRRLLDAVRQGRVYSAITALATPARFDLTASRANLLARMGDEIAAGAPVEVQARVQGPEGTRLRLFENGRLVSEQSAAALTYRAAGHPAVFRAEAWLPRRRLEPTLPWIVSNPIFVRAPAARSPSSLAEPVASTKRVAVVLSAPSVTWRVEHDEASTARVSVDDEGLVFEYALRPGARVSQYAAAATNALESIDAWRLLQFRARASAPMRLSVQVRQSTETTGYRWARSVYLDATPRLITVPLDDFRPVADAPRRIPVADLRTLLLVTDTVNTRPGTRGTVWLDNVRVQ